MRLDRLLTGGLVTLLLTLAACAAPAPPTPTLLPTATIAATATPAPTPSPVPTPTATPAPAPTRSPSPAASIGTTDLRRSLAAFDALSSYRIVGQLDSKESSPVDLTVEYVQPDRRRVVLGTLEIVTIGPTTYVRQGGAWVKLQTAAEPGLAPDVREIAGEFENAAFTPMGTETIEGEPCAIYGYVESEQQGKLWISTRDQLVRKIEGQGPVGTYTLRFTAFNQAIPITAPI